jgi:hypothetical protein
VEIEDRKINVYNISDTNRQTNADMDREIDKNELMRWWTNRMPGRKIEKQTFEHANKQTHKQIDRQTKRPN